MHRVAVRQRLADDWLNDHAEAFTPFGFDVEACEVMFETRQLKVLGAPFRGVFLMKLRRGSPQDLIDMRVLWPYVEDRFATAAEVITAFFDAFPVEYLDRLVVGELAKDGIALPLG